MSLRSQRSPGPDGVNEKTCGLRQKENQGDEREVDFVGHWRHSKYFTFRSELNKKTVENFEQRNKMF